ncbi:MAG: HNH endonuclease signature motif containing protein, partial [Candidatus Krumholzibacteriales bacterium]
KDIKSNNLNRTRYIPRKVKDLVYRRDGGRCSFVSKNGRRCNSTWNLQYDHIVPFGKGGDNSPENLRLLCGRHNQLMAEKEYGAVHMKQFRDGES